MKRKIIAGILIIMGLAIMSAPLYWRWSGNRRNEQMVQEIDPSAFIIIGHVNEVKGRGFSLEREYKN